MGTTIGGTLSGLALAILAGLASPIPAGGRLYVAAAVVLALITLDLVTAKLPLPQRRILIPQDVFHDGMRLGLLRFGIEYGTGVRTLIPSGSAYAVALTLIAANLPWWQTVLIGAVFGLGRSLSALQLLLGNGDGFQAFLGGHTRLLERLATVLAGIVLVLALLTRAG